MSCPTIQNIQSSECIGNSLVKINSNFTSLSAGICDTNSTVINNTWGNVPLFNLITSLSSQILSLSSNMQKIGNYPYLEYAYICAANYVGSEVVVPSETVTTLRLNTEIADSGNFGTLDTGTSRITLSPGTYSYEVYTRIMNDGAPPSTNFAGNVGLYNVSDSQFVTRQGPTDTQYNSGAFKFNGQITLTTAKIFDIRTIINAASKVTNSSYFYYNTTSTPNTDQRTTIKLWKID